MARLMAVPPTLYGGVTSLRHGYSVALRCLPHAEATSRASEAQLCRTGIALCDLSDMAVATLQGALPGVTGLLAAEVALNTDCRTDGLSGFTSAALAAAFPRSVWRQCRLQRTNMACSLIKASAAHFVALGPVGQYDRLASALQAHVTPADRVMVHDTSMAYAVLGIAGPHGLAVIERATDQQLASLEHGFVNNSSDTGCDSAPPVMVDVHQALLLRNGPQTLELVLERGAAVRVAEVLSAAAHELGIDTGVVGRVAYEDHVREQRDAHARAMLRLDETDATAESGA